MVGILHTVLQPVIVGIVVVDVWADEVGCPAESSRRAETGARVFDVVMKVVVIGIRIERVGLLLELPWREGQRVAQAQLEPTRRDQLVGIHQRIVVGVRVERIGVGDVDLLVVGEAVVVRVVVERGDCRRAGRAVDAERRRDALRRGGTAEKALLLAIAQAVPVCVTVAQIRLAASHGGAVAERVVVPDSVLVLVFVAVLESVVVRVVVVDIGADRVRTPADPTEESRRRVAKASSRVGMADCPLDPVRDFVVVGVRVERVGFLDERPLRPRPAGGDQLIGIADSIAICIPVERISSCDIDLFVIRQAVVVRVVVKGCDGAGRPRGGAYADQTGAEQPLLLAVQQAVVIGIRVTKVGLPAPFRAAISNAVVNDPVLVRVLVAVLQAVVIRISIAYIRAVLVTRSWVRARRRGSCHPCAGVLDVVGEPVVICVLIQRVAFLIKRP